MQTHGSKSNPPTLGKLRVLITVLALVILAGTVLLVWLIDDSYVGPVLALAAILVGWLLALILVEPRKGRSPSKTDGADASRCNRPEEGRQLEARFSTADLDELRGRMNYDECGQSQHGH